MAGQQRRGPVDLFQEHDGHQLVRPGRRTEGDPQVGAVAQRDADPVSAAGHKNGPNCIWLSKEERKPGALSATSSTNCKV
jgi:hypothetical protein